MSKLNIWELLRKRYPENECVLMQEVSDAAGFGRSNSADFIAVNLWPSRGLSIIGIELKRSRSDWLSELKKPDKAENIFKYCDYFYLLTTDESAAKSDEIPVTWGWICVKGERIVTIKEAPKLSPIPITRDFMCAMLKRAVNKDKFIHKDSIQETIDTAVKKAEDKVTAMLDRGRLSEQLKSLQIKIEIFEKAACVDMNNWGDHTPENVGRAIRFLNTNGIDGIKKELNQLQMKAKAILSNISNALSIEENPIQEE